MRYLLYTDVHWSEFSSIVRKIGDKYSVRLERLINSVNWAEDLVNTQKCDAVICLGDFFDTPDLNSREITALNEIKWADVPHYFIVGNHEASTKSLFYNSTEVLRNNKNFKIITEPTQLYNYGCNILLLPYIVEKERKSLADYWKMSLKSNLVTTQKMKWTVVLSHNDIKGIRYGAFESKEGFELSDIEANCDLFLNGHIHNWGNFGRKGTNLGNLCGESFNEDAFKYKHHAFVLDTADHSLEFIENPYALNFYQLTVNNIKDLKKLKEIKNNAVLLIKCVDVLKDDLMKFISENKLDEKILESRILITVTENSLAGVDSEDHIDFESITSSYLSKFKSFCKEKINNSNILNEELEEVCK